MTALLALATSRIGLLVIAFAGIFVFYEGVPIGPLRWIPFAGPVIEALTDGRVDRERKAALDGYVKQVELDAANAEIAKVQRQLDASRKATAGFQELLAELQEADRVKDEQDRIEDANYEAELTRKGRSHKYDADDLRFLLR